MWSRGGSRNTSQAQAGLFWRLAPSHVVSIETPSSSSFSTEHAAKLLWLLRRFWRLHQPQQGSCLDSTRTYAWLLLFEAVGSAFFVSHLSTEGLPPPISSAQSYCHIIVVASHRGWFMCARLCRAHFALPSSLACSSLILLCLSESLVSPSSPLFPALSAPSILLVLAATVLWPLLPCYSNLSSNYFLGTSSPACQPHP
ncbi:hypothetical protein B0I35DRAFT_11569 [Stachybotrys elegans]|uniref:Uncharacterized protein n=1 Tax=Stachybotrys elegans TaxID=80388 RepID=A0A8K0T1K5_9HYPO|nr:hypothetical protein B0I35DRAFT_11569 [Stachybotrys elegans]